MKDFRLAVKAMIVHKRKVLIVKRNSNQKLRGGMWELPGGRLNYGEDPIIGLMREIREETGIYIDVKKPISVRHFTRDDNKQIITMIIFLAKPKGGLLNISEEHEDIEWVDIKDAKEKLGKFFWKEVDIYLRDYYKR